VEVDTHLTGILHHASGAISSVTVSFDGIASTASPIEVHGVDGSLVVPDPNLFAGQVRLHTRDTQWTDFVPTAGFADAGRGIGLIDFLSGHRRASGEMALHCLEIMTLWQRSAESGIRERLSTSVERPALVPLTEASSWRHLDHI
jgi:predicted dehydrogenase